ncbi:MAG: hypothetical protein V1838_03435 [Patescibacteria group bacterium]
MTFRYRDILKNALIMTWRHKFLWFFGLFAALTSNGEEYDTLIRNANFVTGVQDYTGDLKALANDGSLSQVWQDLTSYVANNLSVSVATLLVSIIVALFIVWLIIVSQVAIISSVARQQQKQPISIIEGFWSGNKLFPRILAINLIALLLTYGLLILVNLPFLAGYFAYGNAIHLTVIVILTFIILLPVNVIISFITKYAVISVVFKNNSIGQAIRNGWQLLIKNWLVSLETAFVLFLINFLVSIMVIGAISISGIPVVNMTGFIVFFAISAVLGAILATFQYSVWSYLFIELNQRTGLSKLVRLFSRDSSGGNRRSVK